MRSQKQRKSPLIQFVLLFVILTLNYAHASLDSQDTAKDIPQKQTAEETQLPSEASTSWWEQVQKNLASSEYHVSWQQQTQLENSLPAWQAPNRANNLRSYFTEQGLRVIPRDTTETPAWRWGMELQTAGYADQTKPVQPAKIEVTGERVEYRRGDLTEWYINDTKGVEQGFTFHQPPAGTGDTLELRLKLHGDLNAGFHSDNQRIDFTTQGGVRAIQYDSLKAWDANGKDLPASFRLEGDTLAIQVAAVDVRYPVTIDPLATSPAWTAESDQADAQFGVSVASAGDVNGDGYADVVVGAHLYDNGQTDEGRAFVYHGSASGLATTAAWTAESDQVSAVFGYSVASAGDVNGDGYADVIVGAYKYDNGQTDEGMAFVYHGSASGLATPAAWTVESDQATAWFGYSVASAGDVNGDGYADVIIGANGYDNGQSDEGSAFVYHGSASGLASSAAWTAESDQASAQFGISVASAGDVNGDGYADVIVGAYLYDNGGTDEGRVFVYHGSASGLSNKFWSAESNRAGAGFGVSVAAAGDVNGDGFADVIVGAYLYDNGETEEGLAFVYHGSASGLATTAAWTAESDQASAQFGISVASAGDVNGDGYADVIVGAYRYGNGQINEGRAFVYHGSATGLATTAAWTREGNQASAAYGLSVASAGDVNGDGYADVIVGAYSYDNGQSNEGRAFVYHGAASGLATTAAWTAESDQASARLGNSVASAGDVNGDGYADVIVGALLYDNGQSNEGRAFVYHGSALGLATTAAWTAESDQVSAWFGRSVTSAGDVNGDGYADVIVGAYKYDNGESNEGRAYVYHGSASGLASSADWTAESDQADAWFGYSVASAGDVNGDGYADVIIGAYLYDNGQTDEGRAFVYHGSASGLVTTAAWTREGNQANASFGISVASAGDVNGDGYADVIVGASKYSNGQPNEGRAFVYHGSASGLASTAAWTAESNQSAASLGYSVASAGDVNGDGYADVIVGAYLYDNVESNEGHTFVYHGSASGLATTAAWTREGNQDTAYFGYSVASAGDVNGDGYADVIVGAYRYDNGETDEGRAFVYHGSASGLATSAAWTAESDQADAYFGFSVASAGDVNGDGYADVIVGAHEYDNGQSNEGRAFVYYGNGGAGLSLKPQQRRADDTAPVGQGWGVSGASDSLRLAALGRTPFGRSQVKLEWEVKPLGTAFDGIGTGLSSSWIDTGTAGVAINQLVDSLSNKTLYHWRLRLHYKTNTVLPGTLHSRWFTVPQGGWEQTSIRVGAKYAITVTAGTNGSVSANSGAISACSNSSGVCTDTYYHGSTITLTATPSTNYSTSWSGADAASCSGDSCTFSSLSSAKTVTASFPLISYAVTVTGGANGSVSADSGAISGCTDASGICTDNYDHFTSLVLTATPATGYSTSWSGIDAGFCSGDICIFGSLSSAKSVTASFTLNNYAVSVTGGSNGSVNADSGAINACTDISGTCTDNYDHFTDLVLTATPATGYSTSWSGTDATSCSGDSCTFSSLSSSKSVTASFTLNSYAITEIASPVAGGSVTCTPNPVSHGSDVNCIASASTGYTFANWSGDCTGTGACDLTSVTSTKSVTASFTLNSYVLTEIASPVAGGSVTCTPNPVNHGSDANCTASANTGYSFANWSGDCTGTGACDLTSVTSTKSVTASFTLNSYVLTEIASPVAGGSVTCTPNPVNHGSDANCTASANTGYTFASWSGDCTGTGACDLTSVTSTKTVTASFTLNGYAVTVTGSSNGSVSADSGAISSCTDTSGTCTDNYDHFTDLVLTATPATGYSTAWSGTDAASCNSNSCTFNNLSSAKTVTASFTLNSHTVTVTGGSNGSVNADSGAISGCTNASGTCTDNYSQGSDIILTATPSTGYSTSWSGTDAGSCSGDTCLFGNLGLAKAVTASFTLNSHTVTVTGGSNGSVSADSGAISGCTNASGTCTDNYDHFTDLVLTATPDTGYSTAWSGTNAASCSGNTCTFSSLSSAKAVTASFTLNNYTVTPSAGANGSISPTTAQSVNHGTTTSFTITPASGYAASIGGTCGGTLTGNSYTTDVITTHCTVEASFLPSRCASTHSITTPDHTQSEIIQAESTLNASGGVQINSGMEVIYEAGSSITLSPDFHAVSGSQFRARITAISCPASRPARDTTQVRTSETTPPIITQKVSAIRHWSASELPAALLDRLYRAGIAPETLTDIQSDAESEQILFTSPADLIPQDDNGHSDIYRYHTQESSLHLLSHNREGEAANGPSDQPRLSENGSWVVFRSEADDLSWNADGNGGGSDIYLYHLDAWSSERISQTEPGESTQTPSAHPDLTGDLPTIVYDRENPNGQRGIYQHQPLGDTQRLDNASCDAHHPILSSNGNYLAWLCGEPEVDSDCTLQIQNREVGTAASQPCPPLDPKTYYGVRFDAAGQNILWTTSDGSIQYSSGNSMNP